MLSIWVPLLAMGALAGGCGSPVGSERPPPQAITPTATAGSGGGSRGGGGGGDEPIRPSRTPPKSTEPSEPPSTTSPLEEYKSRCRTATKELSPATVVWQQSYKMDLGREAVINVALTLRTSVPPSKILPGATSPAAERVLVACRVTGTLLINSGAFSVASETPRVQSVEVLSSQDARWHWLVTPNREGTFNASVELRPVVSIQDKPERRPLEQSLPSRSFDATVIVTGPAVPPDEAISDMISRWTGVLLKMTALLAAAAGLLGAVHRLVYKTWLPWRRPGKSKKEPDPGPNSS